MTHLHWFICLGLPQSHWITIDFELLGNKSTVGWPWAKFSSQNQFKTAFSPPPAGIYMIYLYQEVFMYNDGHKDVRLAWQSHVQREDTHSPHEIISTMAKTGKEAWRKRKPCRKVFIHIRNKSASDKLRDVLMESSKLLCLNGISFCSKSCKLKTFPLSIASVNGPRPWGLEVIYSDSC